MKFKPRTIKCRNYSKNCAARFKDKLSSVSWDNVSECQDFNDTWLNFRTSLLRVVDNHAPQIEKKTRGRNTPWLSSTIRKVITERSFLPPNSVKMIRLQCNSVFVLRCRTNTELHWSRYETEKSGHHYDS